MAMFKTHISLGALLAAVGVVLLYFYAVVTDPILLLFLFGVTAVGSFLPDLDIDTGTPFYIIYGLFTLLSGAGALYYMLQHGPYELYVVVGVPIAVMLFVWFGVGEVFKRFTHHRGIMHSIPAMGVVALLVYVIARHLEQGDFVATIFAVAVALGYFSHLALDEIYAENAMGGNPFEHRRSLGTAVKFFSDSKWITLFTYLLLFSLVYIAVGYR
jgi:membrane-bound metal-dependent hydrolase YbcI (DUF457 family)